MKSVKRTTKAENRLHECVFRTCADFPGSFHILHSHFKPDTADAKAASIPPPDLGRYQLFCKKVSPRALSQKILALAMVLAFFATPARAWDGGETRMEALSAQLGQFIERVEANYTAGAGARDELAALLEKYSKVECSSDFRGFLEALDALASKAETECTMHPDAVAELRGIYGPDLATGCPAGMTLIEGDYCIDTHEWPGTPGEAPTGGASWNEAAAKCAERGQRLCSGPEWVRACRGNTTCSDTLFGEDFDPAACGVSPQYVAPGADWKIADRPRCRSAYGVDDMAGGLWEWTDEGYKGALKVLRSGASPKDPSPTCDETSWAATEARMEYVGFRCCASTVVKMDGEKIADSGQENDVVRVLKNIFSLFGFYPRPGTRDPEPDAVAVIIK